MPETSELVYQGIRTMARMKHNSNPSTARAEVSWGGLTCVYYPDSNRFNWFSGKRDITQGMAKTQVIALIKEALDHARPD